MSDITVMSATQRIVVDRFSRSVGVINTGPIGPVGPRGPLGVPGTEGDYVTDAELASSSSALDARLDVVEAASVIGLWTTATLINGFIGYPGWPAPRYRKDNDIVRMDGLFRGLGVATGTVMTVLPVGFRPVGSHVFVRFGQTDQPTFLARIDIHANGNVMVHAGNTDFMGWYGIQFSTI